MKKLYLHIGTPKTGTSTLQYFFSINKEVLYNKGIFYPDGIEYDKSGGIESTAGNFGWLTRVKEPKRMFEKFITDVFAQTDSVLCSTENIWLEIEDKPNFLMDIKKMFPDLEIKVIVYLRKQIDYLESQYREFIRVLSLSEPFEEIIKSNNPVVCMLRRTLDYYSIIDDMAKVIGKENILVRPYETEQFIGGNIISDFLNLLGIELDNEFKLLPKNYNPSIDNATLEMKRCMNMSHLATQKEMNDIFYEILMTEGIEKSSDGRIVHFQSLLSSEQKNEFMKRYEEGNRKIAIEYLGKENGILFEHVDKEGVGAEIDTQEVLQQVIRVFTSVNINWYRKYNELQRTSSKLQKTNSDMQNNILQMSETVEDLQREIREYKKECEKRNQILTNELQQKEKQLTWMQNTQSWKITAPLRKIVDFIRRYSKK